MMLFAAISLTTALTAWTATDVRPTGTAAPTIIPGSGNNAILFNTLVAGGTNPGKVTLNAGMLEFHAGVYQVQGLVAYESSSAQTGGVALTLVNNVTGTTAISGPSYGTPDGSGGVEIATTVAFSGILSVAATTPFWLNFYSGVGPSYIGQSALGGPVNQTGVPETYAQVVIIKID